MFTEFNCVGKRGGNVTSHWEVLCRSSGILAVALVALGCAPETNTNVGAGSSAPQPIPVQREGAVVIPDATTGRVGIVERGEECPRIRFEDGTVVTLERAPVPTYTLTPGTRVRVIGEVLGAAAVTKCQQGRGFVATAIDIL